MISFKHTVLDRLEEPYHEAVKLILNNEVIAIESDTILGLSCLFTPEALKKLEQIKGRKERFIVAGAKVEHFLDFIDLNSLTDNQLFTLSIFHPKPTTFIVPAKDKVNNVALRLIKPSPLRNLILSLDAPLTTTSANPRGKAPALSQSMLDKYFQDSIYYFPLNSYKSVQTNVSTIIELKSRKIIRE